MVEKIQCELCGAETKYPVKKTIDGRVLNFCCAGCLQVYELQGETELRPGDSGPGAPARFQTTPVSPVDRQPGGTMSSKTITLPIVGMTCANCVAHVAGGLRSVPGVLDVNVNLATERATVELIPGVATIADLKHAVEAAGYGVLPMGDAQVGTAELVDRERVRREAERRRDWRDLIIPLVKVGKSLEARANVQTSEAIKNLMRLRAKTARRTQRRGD
jgi:copper chaperone CopZ